MTNGDCHVDRTEIRELLSILQESGWDNVSIVTPNFTLTLGNPPPAAAPVNFEVPTVARAAVEMPKLAATSAVPEVTPSTGSGSVITAPSIGVIWRAPKPGAPPFVEVGQEVGPDDVVFLIEVMKLFTTVPAGVAGRVSSFHVENGAMVEYGTPVLTIE